MTIPKQKIDFLNQHSRPTTRREFVAMGMAAAGGVALSPTLFSLLGQSRAQAAGVAAPELPGFITFDLAGGAGLPGNFLVGKSGGALDLLPSYSSLGWDPKKQGWDARYGLPMGKAEVSRLFGAMTTAMSPEAQARFRMGSLLHVSRDDTSANQLSVLNLVSKAGFLGARIQKAVGNGSTRSAGNSDFAQDAPGFAPRPMPNLKTLLAANASSSAFLGLGSDLTEAIFKRVNRLSTAQAARALGLAIDDPQIRSLDTIIADAASSSTAVDLDPRQSAAASAVYGINANTSDLNEGALRAALALGSITGTTGPSVITIGGCDYHDSTQTTGDNKDTEIGQEIGRAVELAHRLKRPLFVHIITDGGVSSTAGGRVWNADNGEHGMSVLGYYHPDAAPTYRKAGVVQIGAYTDGQGADRSTLIGANPSLAALATFTNYMNVAGRINEVEAVIGRPFSSDEVETILLFA